MRKFSWCLISVILIAQVSKAQTRFIVKFKDKGNNPFSLSNPIAYLSQRAIDRRTRYSITIDSADLPVTPSYVDSVRLAGAVTILNVSKWLNSVSIQTTDAAAISKINSFPFVQSASAIASRPILINQGLHNKFNSAIQSAKCILTKNSFNNSHPNKTFNITSDFFNYGASYNQVHIHNGEFLHNIGLRGQSMIIGMLDAGFNNYLTVKAFDSVRANGQILGIYDFVAHDNSVNEDAAHGMECFSTMAANIPGQFVGTAPKANFYLFRTEDVSSEYPIEEHNWVCGAEKIDSAGGNVISSSLGYNTFDPPLTNLSHTYADMNGHTTMIAIGAGIAAKKGILVVNAAGNEGTNSWHYIITPADGDSVLAVGAVTTSGAVAGFSSYGPSSGGQIKPDVASVGVNTVIESPFNTVSSGSGTSFACPNLAGLATCLWQGFQEFNNMKIVSALRQSGSIASAPDDRIGYGIPDVKKAVMSLLKDYASSSLSVSNCIATLKWTSKDVSSMEYVIERLIPGQPSFIKIAERSGSGSIFSNHSYQYADTLTNVPAGMVSYRILQIIDTAAASVTSGYIDTASVNLTISCTGANEILVIPNPVLQNFTLKVSTLISMPDMTIRVFNTSGQLITSLKRTKPEGVAFFDVPLPPSIAKGKYYVNVYTGTKLFATKEFIKL